MKRLLCLFMVIITVLMLQPLAVFADGEPLTFVVSDSSNEILPDATVNTPYSARVEITGGTPPYSCTIKSASDFPPGIDVKDVVEDGVYYLEISGTPKVGEVTYCNMTVVATDADGNTAEQVFTLKIIATLIDFEIGDNVFMYNGMPHGVEAKPYKTEESGPVDVSAYVKDYTITYSGAESQTDVGDYGISIRINTSGYVTRNLSKTRMQIIANNTATFSFEGNSFNYDKSPKSPVITATGFIGEDYDEQTTLEYTTTYVSTDGGGYNDTTPPTNPGKYRVTCQLTSKNFSQPANNSTTFEILPNTVNFALDNQDEFIYGSTWDRTYKPTTEGITDTYTVTYTADGGTPLTTLTGADAGEYTVNIAFGEGSIYTVGTITPPTVTVKKKTVNFTVSSTTHVYTGEPVYPVISNDSGLNQEQYTVQYFKIDDNTTPVEPTDVGEYKISITLADSVTNYEAGSVTPDVFTITNSTAPVIELGDGNSIFAQINAAGGDIAGAKSAFASSHTYNGKLYSAAAWVDGANLDMDEKALFVYYGQAVTLPAVSATDKEGNPIAVNAIIIANGEEKPLTGSTYTTDLPLGVYTIKYTAADDDGSSSEATRAVVVLWQLGDVNFDKNVNSIDGNYIKGNLSLAESTPNEKLFKYRMCDVNMDGAVNTQDMFAIYNRINAPLAEYYR